MTFDATARPDADGVSFRMHFPDGPGEARVTAQALKEYFGAAASPEGLLESYRANFRAIHAVAQQKAVGDGQSGITVETGDLREWQVKGAARVD
jgi:hypothetical protein